MQSSDQRAVLLINPNAHRSPAWKRLATGAAWLRERGWQVDIRQSERRGDLELMASEAARDGLNCVVAYGGDGTLHEALNGVVGSATALALIPAGTANVWAYEAGLPRDPVQALRLLVEGRRVRIDTGRASGRAFLLMASVGLDSLVAGQVSGRLKRYLGYLPYLARAAVELQRFRGLRASVLLDGERVRTPLVGIVAGNTRRYGGLIEIAREARADDGMLDICIFAGEGRLTFLKHLLRTIRAKHTEHPSVIYRQARHVQIDAEAPWPVQLDGEVQLQTPVTLECVPRSVTVVVSRDHPSPLWDPPPVERL